MAGLSDLFRQLSDWHLQQTNGNGTQEAAAPFQNRHTKAYGFVTPRQGKVMGNLDLSRPEDLLTDNIHNGPKRDLPTLKGLTQLLGEMKRSIQSGTILVDPRCVHDGNTVNHEAAHELFARSGMEQSPKMAELYQSINSGDRDKLETAYKGEPIPRIVDEAGAYSLGSTNPSRQALVSNIADAIPDTGLGALYRKLDAVERTRIARAKPHSQ